MAAILCLLQAEEKQNRKDDEKILFSFDWAIIIAASFPAKNREERFSQEVEKIKGKICTYKKSFLICSNVFKDRFEFVDKKYFPATMHVWGSADPIVAAEDSKKLAELFPDPVIYEHDGKHFMPVTSPAKQQYSNFVDKFK